MRYASIDIGTNMILMLIGEIINDSLEVIPLKDFYAVPRLGKNVSVTKELDGDSIARAMKVLKNYKSLADNYKVDKIIATATSAVRDSVNKCDFVEKVKDNLGIEVEVISGKTEANLIFLGSGAPELNKPTLVIDIGGGSTELGFGTGFKTSLTKSIDIGAVRITEKFLHHNPPNADELKDAEKFIERELSQFPFSEIDPTVIIGVAGTPTTLALIAQKRFEFEASAVTHYRFTIGKLYEVFDQIKVMATDEILKLTKAAEGRADVLVAGALILLKVLNAVNTKEFLTTDRGLRHGYLLYKHMQFQVK